ncbi:MAG: hypothetical protein D6732_11820 [Methanobacteriota archaeon]|nr:MAG: hypothetical protein D6732_11820 [Euryarchaeota archaeon]
MVIGLETSFSELKKYTVVDNEGVEVGKPIDIVFEIETDVLTKLILGGSFIEEMRERLGLKEDDDPVVSITDIQKVENQTITLNVSKENLGHKLESGAIAQNELLFSVVSKYTVFASDGEKLGRFIDAVIHVDNSLSFIIGDSMFKEFLERVGLTPDFDLLVPCTQIKEILPAEKKVTLAVTKDLLLTTLDGLPYQEGIDRLNISRKAGREADYMRFKVAN